MKHFKSVLWIIADSAEKIEQSFGETAELLGMPNAARNSSQAKTYVLQRLSSCADEFLLCFDNADNMSLIDDCFPRSSRGAILITTRDASRSGDYAKDTLLVSDLSMEEAKGFLTAHLNRLDLANDEGSTELLWKICKLVHGYPLALSHIAAFIRKGGHSLARFIQMKCSKTRRSVPRSLSSKFTTTTPPGQQSGSYAVRHSRRPRRNCWIFCHSSIRIASPMSSLKQPRKFSFGTRNHRKRAHYLPQSRP